MKPVAHHGVKFKQWKQSSLTTQRAGKKRGGVWRPLRHEHCRSPSCVLCDPSALLIIHHPFLCKTTRPMLQNRCTPPILLLSWRRANWTSGAVPPPWRRNHHVTEALARRTEHTHAVCGAEKRRQKTVSPRSASPKFFLVSVIDFKTN